MHKPLTLAQRFARCGAVCVSLAVLALTVWLAAEASFDLGWME